jgi:multiple sugar transport system ATP-binding protein
MARVLLNDVYKIYHGAKNAAPAVQNFSLDIADKEFVALIGPSGCGKSTTLRMIAGLESVTKGEIYIDDRMVNDLSPKNRNISMVFQNYALYPTLSNYENIAFGLRVAREAKYKIEEKVNRIARSLEIDHLMERYPRQISGGQRQRVALGRAIVRDPKVFLMDEPLSNLDAKMRVQMRIEIINIHKRLDTTTIYVTHDQIEAMTMADKIVIMDKGIIQQVGTPEEVYNYPANKFVGGFIGTPPMNFIEGYIMKNDNEVEFYNGSMSLRIPAAKAKVLESKDTYGCFGGIRPEHLEIVFETSSEKLNTFKGKVEVTELIGADRHVHLEIAGQGKVVVRTAASNHFKDGELVTVRVNMEKFLFFDRNSGVRIV